MSYPLVFKKMTSPREQFTKTFYDEGTTYNVVIKDETEVFRPTFTIQTTDNLKTLYNYIDGSNFSGRQYFIDRVINIGNNRYEVSAHTDVLSTWSSQIKANEAIIRRQQNKYNLYLDDPEFHLYNSERLQTLKLDGSEFDKNLSYILVVNGA